MSSLLAKFSALSRIKVDPILAERWDFEARRYGEHPIKQQIAQAKRTATTLQNARKQFLKISPEQELALTAAASAMRSLAAELVPLVAWAKAYKGFCEAEYKRERLETLEAIAVSRWGTDASAVQFEADLVQELASKDGERAFALWLHSTGQHTDVALENISSCVNRLGAGSSWRERVAATIEEEQRATDNKWGSARGLRVICGWQIYERYLAHRKDVALKTTEVLAGLSTVSQPRGSKEDDH